jgi:hypothetical protein
MSHTEDGPMNGDHRRDKTGRERVLPPIGRVAGGVPEGIAMIDVSALQEIDDLEYVERMKSLK